MKTLLSINEVASSLNVSIRTIQLKCKKQGILKIGNQYQITDVILNDWIKEQETKSETKVETKQKSISISHTKQKKLRFASSQIVAFILMLILLIGLYIAYNNYNAIISDLKNDNKEINKEYKEYKKVQDKRLFDAYDVISNQSIEIENLKVKDSIRNGIIKL